MYIGLNLSDFMPLNLIAKCEDVSLFNGTVVICDNEPRSKEIVKKMANLIDTDYELVIWPSDIQEKDVNDMILAGRQDIKTIIDNNTFSGLEAKLKLAAWKR